MIYAPGQDADEKLHQFFHANMLQGIRCQVSYCLVLHRLAFQAYAGSHTNPAGVIDAGVAE